MVDPPIHPIGLDTRSTTIRKNLCGFNQLIACQDWLNHASSKAQELSAPHFRERHIWDHMWPATYDPDNRLVAATLEAHWNDRLRALAQAREEAERQRKADRMTLEQATGERIRALAEDFAAVWNDPATSHRDRKRIAQLLLEDVTLLKNDRLHVHMRFKGGVTESLVLPLPKNSWRKRLTPPDIVARVQQLLGQHEEQDVAEQLNAEGLRSGAGKPFYANTVRWIRYAYGLKTPAQRLHETGKLTVREMAAQLGKDEGTIRHWVRDGRLGAARHERKPIWLCDPLDEQPEAIREIAARYAEGVVVRPSRADSTPPDLRMRIEKLLVDGHNDDDVAKRLDAEGWSTQTGAPFDATMISKIRGHCGIKTQWKHMRETGKLTPPEMAVRLGIGLKTVRNWARDGRLRGQPCNKVSRASWLFDPIDEQPEPIRQLAAARGTIGVRRGLLSDAAIGRGAI